MKDNKTSEAVRHLITKFNEVIAYNGDESNIIVVRKKDNSKFYLNSVTNIHGDALLKFVSCEDSIHEISCNVSEFDSEFMLMKDYEKKLIKDLCDEINCKLFKLVYPVLSAGGRDYSYEIVTQGKIINIRCWELINKYENLVIQIYNLHEIGITLYSRTCGDNIEVFKYKDQTAKRCVCKYGPLTEDIIDKICDIIEEIIRRYEK